MLSRRLLRTKVLRALYSHFKSERISIEVSLGEYRKGVDRCYGLYLLLLELPVEVAALGSEKMELVRHKLRPTADDLAPNRRFVDGAIIGDIAGNEVLGKRLKEYGLSWVDGDKVVRELYGQVMASELYSSYMGGAIDERTFLTKVFTDIIEDDAILEEAIEDMSMFWIDDTSYAVSQVVRTLQGDRGRIRILDKFNDDEDRLFGERLFIDSVNGMGANLALIDELAENWDLERIAYLDRLIMAQALAEIMSCATIPVKVSLDEYIEISKYYSTPTSSTFINGVLNKAVERLQTEGRIIKTGRGLIDK